MLLTILIILSVLFMAGFLFNIKEGPSDTVITFLIMIILLTVFGWGLIGIVFPVRSSFTDIEEKVFVQKSATTAYVEYKNLKAQFTDAASYNAINDSTNFQIQTEYNLYGRKCFQLIVIKKEIKTF